MKKVIIPQKIEVEGKGLDALLGQNVLIFCMIYIYTGKLIGVNTSCILLENVKIVYETGPFTSNDFKDAQLVASEHYIQINSIESFCQTNKI